MSMDIDMSSERSVVTNQSLLTYETSISTQFIHTVHTLQQQSAINSVNDLFAALSTAIDTTQHLNDYLSILITCRSNGLQLNLTDCINSVAFSQQYTAIQQQIDTLLAALPSTTGLCGHVFTSGESAYQCRTCGIDPTCIQCLPCYRNSDHTGHDVFYVRAGGGGMCDCGDTSSWKLSGCCSKHKGAESVTNAVDVSTVLKNTVKQRLQRTVEFIVRSMSIALSSKQCNEAVYTINKSLRIKSYSESKLAVLHPTLYCVYLLNDEVHSYDQVVHQLDTVIDATQEEAFFLATFVDCTDSALVLITDDAVRADQAKATFNEIELGATIKTVYAHTQFTVYNDATVLDTLKWLNSLASKGAYFRTLIINALLRNVDRSNTVDASLPTLLDTWSYESHLLNKKLFTEIQTLMFALFTDLKFKQRFTERFFVTSQNYQRLLTVSAKQGRLVQNSALDWTVQLLTIPSIALYMCQQHMLASKIIAQLLTQLDAITDTNHTINAVQHSRRYVPYLRLLSDLEYCLRVTDVQQYLLDCSGRNQLNHNLQRIALLNDWCDTLQCIENMDPQKRQLNQHVEFESNLWKASFTLTIRVHTTSNLILQSIQHRLKQYAQSNDTQSMNTLAEYTLKPIVEFLQRLDRRRREQADELDSTYKQVLNMYFAHGKTEDQRISFHHPVHRLFSLLCIELAQFNVAIPSAVRQELIKLDTMLVHQSTHFTEVPLYARLLTPILQLLATSAHIQSGVWIYNGYSIINQQYNYARNDLCNSLRRSDILFVQHALQFSLSAEWLITAIVKAFGLIAYYTQRSVTDKPMSKRRYQQWSEKKFTHVNELLLDFILTLLCDRKLTGQYTDAEQQQLAIIEQLMTGPKKLSELQSIDIDDDESMQLDQPDISKYVTQVADYTYRHNVSGSYELKQQYLELYNPYTTAYASEQKQAAETYYLQRTFSATNEERLYPALPKLVGFRPMYAQLNELMLTDMYIRMIQVNLHQITTSTETLTSERTLNHTLYMIALPLQQQEYMTVEQREQLWRQFNTSVVADIPPITDALIHLYMSGIDTQFTVRISVVQQRPLIKHLLHTIGTLSNDERAQQILQSVFAVSEPNSSVLGKRAYNMQLAKRVQEYHREQMIERIRAFAEKHSIDIPWLKQYIQQRQMQAEGRTTPTVPTEHTLFASPIAGTAQDSCVICRSDTDAQSLCLIGAVRESRVPALSSTAPPAYNDNVGRHRAVSGYMSDTVQRAYTHIRHCGHLLHYQCYVQHIETLKSKHNAGLLYEGHNSIDLSQSQFLCPLCKALSDTLTPLVTIQPVSNTIIAFNDLASAVDNAATLLMSIVDIPTRALVLEHVVRRASVGDIGRFMYDSAEYVAVSELSDSHAKNVFVILIHWVDCMLSNELADDAQAEVQQQMTEALARLTALHTSAVLDNDFQPVRTEPLTLPVSIAIDDVASALHMIANEMVHDTPIRNIPQLDVLADTVVCMELSTRNAAAGTASQQVALLQQFIQLQRYMSMVHTLTYSETQSYHTTVRDVCSYIIGNSVRSERLDVEHMKPYHSLTVNAEPMLHALIAYDLSDWRSSDEHAAAMYDAIGSAVAVRCIDYIVHTCSVGYTDTNHEYAVQRAADVHWLSSVQLHPLIHQLVTECSALHTGAGCCAATVPGLILALAPLVRQIHLYARASGLLNDPSHGRTFNEMLTDLHIHDTLNLVSGQPPKSMQHTRSSGAAKPALVEVLQRYGVSARLLQYASAAVSIYDQHAPRITEPSAADDEIDFFKEMQLVTMYTTAELIRLPQMYDDLFQLTAGDTALRCQSCGSVPKHAALCLVCGRLLCAASECCRKDDVGELTQHTAVCSPYGGVYLTLYDTRIYLISESLAVSYGSVYVDRNNEVDLGLVRGRALHLDQARYDKVRDMWLKHEITNFVSRERNKNPYDCIERNKL